MPRFFPLPSPSPTRSLRSSLSLHTAFHFAIFLLALFHSEAAKRRVSPFFSPSPLRSSKTKQAVPAFFSAAADILQVFCQYGIGARKAFSTPNLLKQLNLKVGKLSIGDALDMSLQDEMFIVANGATVKDMEYHLGRGHRGASTTRKLYQLLKQRATLCRCFVIPLRRASGYTTMFVQGGLTSE